MDLDFSKEQDMLRKSVAEFLSKECPYDMVRDIEDSAEGFDKKMWKKMAKLGWMEIHLPEEYGGLGDPFVDVTIIMEEMGKKAFPSPFFPTVVQCGEVLLKGGSAEQKEAFLPKIAAGKKIMALATQQKVRFMQFSGDLITGYSTSTASTRLEYTNWKRAIEPFARYIPVVSTMGNHEAVVKSFYDPATDQSFQIDNFPYDKVSSEAIYQKEFVNPLNGPESEDGSNYDPDEKNINKNSPNP